MLNDGLRLDVFDVDGRVVLAVAGEIDMATAPSLRAAADRLADRSEIVTLDLSGVTFMDSAGLKVLAALSRRLRAAGGALVLRAPPARVLCVLRISGLDRVVMIDDLDRTCGREALGVSLSAPTRHPR